MYSIGIVIFAVAELIVFCGCVLICMFMMCVGGSVVMFIVYLKYPWLLVLVFMFFWFIVMFIGQFAKGVLFNCISPSIV